MQKSSVSSIPKDMGTKDSPESLKNRLHRLAHDLRNPLGGIRGFAMLLEKDLADKPEQKRLASYIIKGADDLNALITKMIENVDSGKGP